MASETIVEIPVDDLHDSPFNPRETYHEADDLEMVADIKLHGRILQPLLVRPRIGPLFGNDPDAAAGFEVVFGHRRKRNGITAGLPTLPCMVRAMDDAEARRAQISENLSRKDVHPMEEAKGFQALIDDDGMTPDTIAEKFGKSRSYVYGRLKLLAACPDVRKACLAGEIGAEVALLLSRLRTVKLQEKALQAIKGRNQQIEDGGQESFRRIRDLLVDEFTLPIKDALFDAEDSTLLPGAGVCSACPKRAGNAPEFEDVANLKPRSQYFTRGGADVCTDPDCWAAKKTAHLVREAGKLRDTGVEVIDGNKARAALSATGEVKGAYVPLADMRTLLKAVPKAPGKPAPAVPTVWIQNQRDGKMVKAVRAADLREAGLLKAEPAGAKPKKDSYEEQSRRQEERRKLDAARAKDVSTQRMALLRHVRTILADRPRDAFDLRMVAAAALSGVDYTDRPTLAVLWNVKDIDQLKRRIDTMSAPDLTTLLMDCAIVDGVLVNEYNVDRSHAGPLMALAEHYGIDATAVMQASAQPAEPASTPSTAARAPKKAAAGAKKPTVPPAKYRCPDTLMTWSGRGLQPKWLKAALARGAKLADFEVNATPAAAGDNQTDEAGFAGQARDPNTADMFQEAGA